MLAGNDPKEWMDALEYLIEHPDERQAMDRAARKNAFNQFGLSMNAYRVLDVYSKLLRR